MEKLINFSNNRYEFAHSLEQGEIPSLIGHLNKLQDAHLKKITRSIKFHLINGIVHVIQTLEENWGLQETISRLFPYMFPVLSKNCEPTHNGWIFEFSKKKFKILKK